MNPHQKCGPEEPKHTCRCTHKMPCPACIDCPHVSDEDIHRHLKELRAHAEEVMARHDKCTITVHNHECSCRYDPYVACENCTNCKQYIGGTVNGSVMSRRAAAEQSRAIMSAPNADAHQPGSPRVPIKIMSDGTPRGTSVEVDGKPVRANWIEFVIGGDQMAQVSIESQMGHLEFLGEGFETLDDGQVFRAMQEEHYWSAKDEACKCGNAFGERSASRMSHLVSMTLDFKFMREIAPKTS